MVLTQFQKVVLFVFFFGKTRSEFCHHPEFISSAAQIYRVMYVINYTPTPVIRYSRIRYRGLKVSQKLRYYIGLRPPNI